MKVLHSALVHFPEAGIAHQMQWEQWAADQMGLDWQTRLFCPADIAPDSPIAVHCPSVKSADYSGSALAGQRTKLRLLRRYYEWLGEQQRDHDLLLLRYLANDPLQLRFLRRSSKPVFLVHHTLEGPELELAGGLAASLRAAVESWLGPRAIRRSAGVIGVTDEIVAYETHRAGVPGLGSYTYPNGILYPPEASLPDGRGSVPELLFLASQFRPWHGLDLLLESVRRSSEQFRLHLVGNVWPADFEVAAADGRVVVHGLITLDRIRSLAASCAVGLSSFALSRNRMSEACPLKVRECLLLGLPVYAGNRDVFPGSFAYYRQGAPDVAAILAFAREMALAGRAEVRAAARPYIDKMALLDGLSRHLGVVRGIGPS